MSVLGNTPFLDYGAALNHFLQARHHQHLQQNHQQQMHFLPSSSASEQSSSPSPPIINGNGNSSSSNNNNNNNNSSANFVGKSFTIDAILGNDRTANYALDYSSSKSGRDLNGNGKLPDEKSSGKCKRVRTIFTPEQLERLEAEFERQQYMVGPERLYLAHTLQLTEAQVKVWFQNRRIKWRKQHLEITQQRLALLKQHRQQRLLQQQQAEYGASNEDHFHRSSLQ